MIYIPLNFEWLYARVMNTVTKKKSFIRIEQPGTSTHIMESYKTKRKATQHWTQSSHSFSA